MGHLLKSRSRVCSRDSWRRETVNNGIMYGCLIILGVFAWIDTGAGCSRLQNTRVDVPFLNFAMCFGIGCRIDCRLVPFDFHVTKILFHYALQIFLKRSRTTTLLFSDHVGNILAKLIRCETLFAKCFPISIISVQPIGSSVTIRLIAASRSNTICASCARRRQRQSARIRTRASPSLRLCRHKIK
mmetsp:Transcript_8241/g.17512  ORF Transcript_8241/g.17512 Transcript_8241/m.17512 type:complete len:186 (+) Transcript_8241:806-1363(+)